MIQDKEEADQKEEGTQTIARAQAAVKPRHPMEILLKIRSSAPALREGDIIEGHVLERKGSKLFVDLGNQGTGTVYGREYYIAQDIIEGLKFGDAVSAKIIETDNEEGFVELSLKDAGEEKRWLDLKKLMQSGETIEIPVLEANRGGLILEARGVKGFLPASQLSSKHYPRVEGGDKEKIYGELQKLVGEPLRLKILDVNPLEGKLIFTEKELDQEALRQTLSQYKTGDEVEGDITGVVDFGAFMKFDNAGLEGLIHISEIDWTLIEDPRAVLKQGDHVRAKIIDVQGDKVSLSLKALKEDPWKKAAEKYKKGDVVHGKVTKFNPFGAFVGFEADLQGLVHISEFGTEIKMKSELEVGKSYDFRILLLDPVEHRMSLGMMQNEVKEEQKPAEDAADVVV